MLETLGVLIYAPWIYLLIALSVLLDVFLPVLPSGVLVVTAATAAGSAAGTAAGVTGLPAPPTPGAHAPELVALVLCAAIASVIGDVLAYRLAWRGGQRFDRAVARSRRLRNAQERLGHVLARGGGALVVLARFAPAGRSVVSLCAGASHRRAKDFVPWSALAGLAWASYSVGLGYLGSQWLGASWLSTAVSLVALVTVGMLAGFLLRRSPAPAPAT